MTNQVGGNIDIQVITGSDEIICLENGQEITVATDIVAPDYGQYNKKRAIVPLITICKQRLQGKISTGVPGYHVVGQIRRDIVNESPHGGAYGNGNCEVYILDHRVTLGGTFCDGISDVTIMGPVLVVTDAESLTYVITNIQERSLTHSNLQVFSSSTLDDLRTSNDEILEAVTGTINNLECSDGIIEASTPEVSILYTSLGSHLEFGHTSLEIIG